MDDPARKATLLKKCMILLEEMLEIDPDVKTGSIVRRRTRCSDKLGKGIIQGTSIEQKGDIVNPVRHKNCEVICWGKVAKDFFSNYLF